MIYVILTFTLWITFITYYHKSPLHELDNYLRFLILLPFLSVTITRKSLNMILNLCALGGILHFLYIASLFDIGRFEGTSSNAITYANLCALLLMICIYNIYTCQKSEKKRY